MLAVVRPDSWNLPLFLHVLGAMVLVGTLATAAVALLASSGRTGHGSSDSRSARFSSPACGVRQCRCEGGALAFA